MTIRPPIGASPDGQTSGTVDALDQLDRALDMARTAFASLLERGRSAERSIRSRSALAGGGLVLLTDDGHGVGRAVAADLKALGHPVLRVRHGVGEGEVEGVNLTSAAAVAALVERARGRGKLAAVVHLAPLRSTGASATTAWDGPDDARALALLAQASAEELRTSARHGGGCLVVVRNDRNSALAEPDRLARWVEISSKTLGGVRVRGLEVASGGEPEVVAAEVVRAVLGTDEPEPPRTVPQPIARTEAILLGAPDRAAWIHLAAALADWLDDSPGVRLVDLAHTLHVDQPSFPFRVGLVARSGSDLADRLRQMIAKLAETGRQSIADPAGAYWCVDAYPSSRESRRSRTLSGTWTGRLRGIVREIEAPPRSELHGVRELLARTGRDWLNHLVAERFARGERVRLDALRSGRDARILDLSEPLSAECCSTMRTDQSEPPEGGSPALRALDSLDSVVAFRREIVEALSAGGRFPA